MGLKHVMGIIAATTLLGCAHSNNSNNTQQNTAGSEVTVSQRTQSMAMTTPDSTYTWRYNGPKIREQHRDYLTLSTQSEIASDAKLNPIRAFNSKMSRIAQAHTDSLVSSNQQLKPVIDKALKACKHSVR